MRHVNDFNDANIVLGDLKREKDLKNTKDWDFHQLKITNASPAVDDFDYTTLSQLNPKIICKIGIPLLGTNITNRISCEAQPGVRLMRWRILANEAPTGTSDIFDVRRLKIGETDFTKADSIFNAINNDKIVLPVNMVRNKGSKFIHTPYDWFYEEELIFDCLQVGTTPGKDIYIHIETQLLGRK